MIDFVNRRDFIKLAGIGAVVFVSRSAVSANGLQQENDSFYFVQLSDTHWGFNRPDINPDSQGTLKKAVAAVNGLDEQPDSGSSCGHSPSLAPSPKKLKYLGVQQSRIKGSAFEMSRRESHKDATRSKNFRFREDNEHEKHLTQRHLDCRVGRYVPATNGR